MSVPGWSAPLRNLPLAGRLPYVPQTLFPVNCIVPSAGSTPPGPDQAALMGLQQEIQQLLSQQQQPQNQLASGLASSASFCFM